VLQLRESGSEEPQPYAALSYCWVGEQEVRTTNSTLHRHLTRLNEKDLPATVRDAVLVTERLGITQIWIDSLCIIQDNIHDKTVELAQMPLVYNQATVTIVASRATSVQEGFLRPRSSISGQNPQILFQLPYTNSKGVNGSLAVYPHIEATEPLDFRAWALQERYLSPRILEYGTLRTRWICSCCHELSSSRDHPLTDGFDENARLDTVNELANVEGSSPKMGKHEYFYNLANLYLPEGSWLPGHKRDQWYSLLKLYTHRKLTVPSDRLSSNLRNCCTFREGAKR
jgi:hypothetical protein